MRSEMRNNGLQMRMNPTAIIPRKEKNWKLINSGQNTGHPPLLNHMFDGAASFPLRF